MKKLIVFAAFVGLCSFAREASFSAPGRIFFNGDGHDFEIKNWEFTKLEMLENDFSKVAAEAEIDMTSLDCSWGELKRAVKKKEDWFSVAKHPTSRARVNGATKNADGTWRATVFLSLKGIEKPTEMALQIDGKKVAGQTTINRRDFGFSGDGPKDEVTIFVEFEMP